MKKIIDVLMSRGVEPEVDKYLSPLSCVPLVALTGLGFFVLGFPLVCNMLNRMGWSAVVLTAGGAYNHRSPRTQISCRTDRSGLVRAAHWVRVPYPFQWGRPYFNAGDTFAIMAAAFVSIIETVGVFLAASRYGSATPPPPSVH